MDLTPLRAKVSLESIPLESLAQNAHIPETEKIREVARQFEAVLLRQILTAARKTVIASGDEHESSTTGIYQDMINSQLADAISQSGSFGLGTSLEAQLQRQTQAPPPSSTDP